MDIERLRARRQLDVQAQNALSKVRMAEFARPFRNGDPGLDWVRQILIREGIDPNDGLLAEASSVPCGGGDESADATWVSHRGQVYAIEATISRQTGRVELDEMVDVTDQLGPARKPGTGKSLGLLALELMTCRESSALSDGREDLDDLMGTP